jgi:hypothetical protein
MNIQSTNTFNPTSDILEIGLMAAASPEFADTIIRAMLAAAENSKAPIEAGDATTTQVPA